MSDIVDDLLDACHGSNIEDKPEFEAFQDVRAQLTELLGDPMAFKYAAIGSMLGGHMLQEISNGIRYVDARAVFEKLVPDPAARIELLAFAKATVERVAATAERPFSVETRVAFVEGTMRAEHANRQAASAQLERLVALSRSSGLGPSEEPVDG
jgi:hypothetical protein